jgi:hypothetical protein
MLDIDVIEKIHEYAKMGYKDAQIARKLKIDPRSVAKYRAVDQPVYTQKEKDIIGQLEKVIGIQPPIQPQIQPQQQQTATNTATRQAQQQEEKELYPGETFHKQLRDAIAKREKRTNAHAEPKPAEGVLLEKNNKLETWMNEQKIQQPVQGPMESQRLIQQQPEPIKKQRRDWRLYIKDKNREKHPEWYSYSDQKLDDLLERNYSYDFIIDVAKIRRFGHENDDDEEDEET